MDDEERYEAKAARLVSYMSNAKWRRAFRAVNDAGIAIERVSWRFLGSQHLNEWGWPEECHIDERRFVDSRFLPVEYKWIESVWIPREYRTIPSVPGSTRTQDVDRFIAALRAAGEFELEQSDDGVRLYGYRSLGISDT